MDETTYLLSPANAKRLLESVAELEAGRGVVKELIEERTKQEIPLGTLHNQTIQFATYMPPGSPFVSLGRKITILAPQEAVNLATCGRRIIPALINLLHDEERDWAANVILASISEKNALKVSVYASNIEEWKQTQKEADIRYWKKWIVEKDGLGEIK